jgi:DNA-binding transcriptional MerR regulator
MPVLSDFLGIYETAAEFHVSRRTVSRWVTLKIGPPSLKIGNRRYFRRDSIIKWLAKKEGR